MAAMTENQHDLLIQWVTFRLRDESYGIKLTQVREVLRIPDIAPVPGSPDDILGIINLRGNVVTVVDTRKRLDLPHKNPDNASRIVVIEAEDNQMIGILVDSVSDVVDFPNSQIEILPSTGNEESSKYIQGVISHNGEFLILVDINQFLNDDELSEAEVL